MAAKTNALARAAARLIVAFDHRTLRETLALAKQLRGTARYAKIGSILFTAAGPEAILAFRRLGFDVFLDLKFHDIPSTVEKSCRAAVRHRIAMLTVHASGQREMLEAAVAGVRDEAKRARVPRPLVVGVTVLTSVAPGAQAVMVDRVVDLVGLAHEAGLDGIVASAQEAPAVRARMGPGFRIICPGIRPPGASAGDQQRVVTPADAVALGADLLVVGRPITESPHPKQAAEAIVTAIASANPKSTR